MSDPFGVVGVVLAGKFRVDRLVGEGGYGVVYAGTHLVLGEPIAIKFIKTEADVYLREARILFSLSHPAIVRMYDVGALDHAGMRLPWVVLELVNGPTLDQEIKERRLHNRPFSFAELHRIFAPILDGLGFAHARGVLHRDIKPANIALARSASGSLEPKLLDFGTARTQVSAVVSSLGKTGFTPLYGAPEQWDPQIAFPSPATDVYAIALTFLVAATLTEPYPGAHDIPSIFRAVTSGTGRTQLAMARPDLPPILASAIERALAVRPENRFQNANELRAAFDVAASPPAATVPVRYIPVTPPALPQPTVAAPPRPRSTGVAAIAAGTTLFATTLTVLAWLSYNGLPGTNPAPTRPTLGKPNVTSADDFDFANVVDVVNKHHTEIESCAARNAPFEGVVELRLDVRTTDGRVASVGCSGLKQQDGGAGPDASAFCACAQGVAAAWQFTPPRSNVGPLAAVANETQWAYVRYTSKR